MCLVGIRSLGLRIDSLNQLELTFAKMFDNLDDLASGLSHFVGTGNFVVVAAMREIVDQYALDRKALVARQKQHKVGKLMFVRPAEATNSFQDTSNGIPSCVVGIATLEDGHDLPEVIAKRSQILVTTSKLVLRSGLVQEERCIGFNDAVSHANVVEIGAVSEH